MSSYPRSPRRLDRIFAHAPVFFVTCCTYRRRKLLAATEVQNALVTFSERAFAEHNIAVGRYVIMPDHLHLFICGDGDFALGRWIGILKQYLAKAVLRAPTEDPIWQRGFFDHVLRSDESYAQKWDYVRENPVRAGISKRRERLDVRGRDHRDRPRVTARNVDASLCEARRGCGQALDVGLRASRRP